MYIERIVFQQTNDQHHVSVTAIMAVTLPTPCHTLIVQNRHVDMDKKRIDLTVALRDDGHPCVQVLTESTIPILVAMLPVHMDGNKRHTTSYELYINRVLTATLIV